MNYGWWLAGGMLALGGACSNGEIAGAGSTGDAAQDPPGSEASTSASSSTSVSSGPVTSFDGSSSTDAPAESSGGSSSSAADTDTDTTGSTGDDESGTTTGTPVVCGDGVPDTDGVCLVEDAVFAVSGGPVALATGDVDGDGIVDAVVANRDDDSVAVLHGDGAGGLTEAVVTPLGLDAEPVALATGLVSEDGILDVLVANHGHATISLLHGGAKGFTIDTISTGGAPSDVAIVDLDGAYGLDFAVVNAEDDTLTTWISQPSGTHLLADVNDGGPIPVVDNFVFGNVAAPSAFDVVFAGDLVVGASPGGGDGSIEETVIVVANVPSPVTSLGGADVDGDGELDVIVATEDALVVLIGDGNPGTAEFEDELLGVHEDVVDAVFADVTGEGNLDAVAVSRGDQQLIVYPGKGDGTFDAEVSLPVGSGASGVTTADLDGDGSAEVLVCDAVDGTLTVFRADP